MKKAFAAILAIVLTLVFVPACDSGQTVQFQFKIMNWSQLDYFICAENQDLKLNLDLKNCAYTEEDGARIYEVSVDYPGKVIVREDGRSFWTIYKGFIYEYSETYTNTLKNVEIRSGHTTVDVNIHGGGDVMYDTVKNIYSDGNFTLFVCEGMETKGIMLHDTQLVWVEKDGERESQQSILPGATIQLLGVNEPNANGEVETWFSVISGAEGVGEIDRFSVKTNGEGQPECDLTLADLPDVTSEKDAKWLDDAEFAADGIKPDTDVQAMKAAFGEPISSRQIYGDDAEYTIYQYDGVHYQFYARFFNGDEWVENNRPLTAEFSENLVAFPRGIKIGDSFEAVLKKFPQEMDYKDDFNNGLFYGDRWRKDKLGWGSVYIANNNANTDNGVWISAICDEYWPMLQVHFNDELIADKITVQFSATPYYN